MAERPNTIKGPDGKLRIWQPDTKNVDLFNYLQQASGFSSLEEAQRADEESGQGSYVLTTDKEMPWWLKAFIGTGLASAGITGIGALAAPGAFGLGGAGTAAAGTGAAAAAPSLGVPIGGVGSAGALSAGAGLPSVGLGGALAPSLGVPIGVGGLPAGVGAGVPLGSAPAAGGGVGAASTLGKVGRAGQVLTNYASGAAQGREHEANLNLNADQLRQRQYESVLNERKTSQELENQARHQASVGLWQQQAPSTFQMPADMRTRLGLPTGAPSSSTPVDPRFSDLGKQAYDAAMKRLLSGSDKQFAPPPPLTPQPNESWLDKLARWGGTGASLYGAINR